MTPSLTSFKVKFYLRLSTPFLRETEENAVIINRAIEEFNYYLCKQYLGVWDREKKRVKIRPKTNTDKIR